MFGQLRALFIEPSTKAVDRLVEGLQPDFLIIQPEVVDNFSDALTSLVRANIDICFISSKLPQDKLSVFLRDVRGSEKSKDLVCVLVRERIDLDSDRLKSGIFGIDCVISRLADVLDKGALNKAVAPLQEKFKREAFEERATDVSQAVEVLLRHMDEVARAKKRGANAELTDSLTRFIEGLGKADNLLLERFFEVLESESATRLPEAFESVQIPEAVLKAKLPHFNEKGYHGPSDRVWKRLAKRAKAAASTAAAAEGSTPPSEEKSEEQK